MKATEVIQEAIEQTEKKGKFKLSRNQRRSIRLAIKRLNIWKGAVRSGKTFASILRWIEFVATAPTGGELLMVGKSVNAVYRNVIRPMKLLLGDQMQYFSGKQVVKLFGREIFVFGAYDESSEEILRGITAAGIYGDEVTLWPESFFKMCLSRMSVPGAKLFGTTNPDNPYHYLKVQYLDNKELDLVQFDFCFEDNPELTKEFKDNLKKEYVGIWYKRFILGLWVAAEGAIFDFFDEEEYVRDIAIMPKADYHVVGVDYGTGNPTVFGLFGVSYYAKPKIWLRKEYFWDSQAQQRQKTDDEYAEDMCDFVSQYKNVEKIIIDPSAASFKIALNKKLIERGLVIAIVDAENSVLDGIRVHAAMLKSKDYVVTRRCKRTIQDYFGYSWDPKAQKKGEDKPLKTTGADHTKDMERYTLFTLFGDAFINYEEYLKD